MHVLSKTVRQFVFANPEVRRVVVAFSGGVDSTVLLHAAVNAELNQPVIAIHVNHQLSDNADAWQSHCAEVCSNMEVPNIALKVKVADAGGGMEQAAREARLKGISEQLLDGDLLLMGHHQQDQVETFFLRLTRGAGLRGLSGMPPLRSLGSALVGKPFLSVPKENIVQYAKEFGLLWVNDESNAYSKFDRNFIRLHILPNIQARWPAFARQVSKATVLLSRAEALLSEYASQDLFSLKPRVERVGHSIKVNRFLDWSEARRSAVVRQWLLNLSYRSPTQKQLAELDDLLAAEMDRKPMLNWGDCELHRYKGRLYCLPQNWEKQPDGVYQCYQAVNPLVEGESRTVPRCGILTLRRAEEGLKPSSEYYVMVRHDYTGSLRFQPHGRGHSQTLKKLLQEYKLEPWLRKRVPFIMKGDVVVAVGDLWVEAEYYSTVSAVTVHWE